VGTTMTVMQSAAVANSSQPMPRDRRGPQASWASQRRSSRLTLDIPVEIYGQGSDKQIFREETRTRVVSAHGALIALRTAVDLEQTIVVVCKRNGQEMRCQVVHREVTKTEVHISIAFLTPSPKFWGVAFPPDDWDRRREL
jgi:hypothetical protein